MPDREQLLDRLARGARRARDWKIGPSSQSSSSQRSASRICSTFSGVERSRSVSSIRSTKRPPVRRARAASCTARCGRRRCAARRSGKERSELAWEQSTHANRRPRLPGRWPGERRRARRPSAGAQAIQIFNQSPRMWRPTAYGEEDFARVPRGDRPRADRRGPDPRRLPAQLRLGGPRDPRPSRCASLIQSLRVGDGDRRGRRRAASRLGQAGRRRARRSRAPAR